MGIAGARGKSFVNGKKMNLEIQKEDWFNEDDLRLWEQKVNV